MNYNIIPRASNTPRLYPSQNGYINYSFNNENNRYAIPYPRNISKPKNINLNINEIPRNNNSVYYQNNNNTSLNLKIFRFSFFCQS